MDKVSTLLFRSGLPLRHDIAYVALSRATKLETLQLVGYSRSKCVAVLFFFCSVYATLIISRVTPHPRVIEWAEINRRRTEKESLSQRVFGEGMDDEDGRRAHYDHIDSHRSL